MARRPQPNQTRVKITLPDDLPARIEQHLTGKELGERPTYNARNDLARRLLISWVAQQDQFPELCEQISQSDSHKDLCHVLIRLLLRNTTTQAIGLRAQLHFAQLVTKDIDKPNSIV
ncbi:MAG: hypothetical protein E6Q97_04455 [Desulfurellales bacterium]|nr:MAG: hypothetical protein E6Q97_04455 [Desulfurellales bacterium]